MSEDPLGIGHVEDPHDIQYWLDECQRDDDRKGSPVRTPNPVYTKDRKR